MPSQIQSIHPYRTEGLWAFDDPATGLVRELLILGTDEIIDDLVEKHLDASAHAGFTLIFSHQPFPGYHIALKRAEPDSGGYWYARLPDGKRGWLCAALFEYFDQAPLELYARGERRK
jgi:hypothetical protein